MQHGLNYRISSCNFIADWTIVMGKVSIVNLALATSELATTDFIWEEKYHSRILPILFFFQGGLFFTTMRLRTELYATRA